MKKVITLTAVLLSTVSAVADTGYAYIDRRLAVGMPEQEALQIMKVEKYDYIATRIETCVDDTEGPWTCKKMFFRPAGFSILKSLYGLCLSKKKRTIGTSIAGIRTSESIAVAGQQMNRRSGRVGLFPSPLTPGSLNCRRVLVALPE